MKSVTNSVLDNLDRETREAAMAAARRAGVPVNEWLSGGAAGREPEGRQSYGRPGPTSAREEELQSVASSIARLTSRIRAMGQDARGTISGLKDRLDEIEDNLGRIPESEIREGRGSRSLRGVSAMVDQLSRELDNADETARSTIEGLRSRVGASGRRETPRPDPRDEQIGQVIRSLDQRIAAMADRLKKPAEGEDRTRKLDALRDRLDGLLARNADPRPAPAARQLDNTLEALERRIGEAKAQIAAPAAAAAAAEDERMRRLEASLASIVSRIAEPPPPDRHPEDDERIQRIEGRLHEITGRLAEPPPPPPPPRRSLEEEEQMRRIESQLHEITSRIADLPPPPPPAPRRTRDEEEQMRRIEGRLLEINSRLDDPPPPARLSHEDAERVRRIEDRLDEVAARLSAPPPPPPPNPALRHMEDLTSAIAEIASRQKSLDDRVETQAIRKDQRTIAESIAALRTDLADLGSRIADIGHAGVEEQQLFRDLSRRIEVISAEGPVDRAILSEIRHELEMIRAAAEDGAREDTLRSRIDDLARTVPDRAHLNALGDEIAAIRHALETADGARSIARLEMRVSELARSVDLAMNARSASIEAGNVAVAAGLTDVRRALDDLINESHRERPDRVGPAIAEVAGGVAEIRAAVDELAVAVRAADPSGRVLTGLSATLADMRRSIDELTVATRESQPGESMMANLATGFSDLRAAIDDLAAFSRRNDPAATVLAGVTGSLNTIRASVEGLADTIRRFDPAGAVISGLSGSLADIRTAIDGLAALTRQADPAPAVIKGLSGSLIDIRMAIDELANAGRTAAPPAVPSELTEAIAEIRQRIEEIAAQPKFEISPATAAANAAVAGLSASLADIRGAIEDLAVTGKYSGPASANAAVASLAIHLDEIRAAIDAQEGAARRADEAALARLESRLDDIAGRIDGVLGLAAPAEVVNGLHDRLEALVDRLDQTSGGAARPAVLEEILAEIATIRQEIAYRETPRVDDLESQIRDLADRMEEVARPDSGATQMAELESQVARLAAELETALPRSAALEQVEANLARLQSLLAENRGESIEAARDAARSAVRELAGESLDRDLVRSLRADLDHLRSASGDTDERTRGTLGALQETLTTIVDRLSRIEAAEGTPKARPAVAPIPTLAAAAAASAASETAARRQPAAPEVSVRERRGDFITAARRAAQAAAKEAAVGPREAPAESASVAARPGAFARIGQAIKNRKKPLLLAAAAVVLAIGAIHLFGPPLLEGKGKTVTADAKASTAVVAAITPAKPAAPAPATVAAADPAPRVADPALVPPTAGWVATATQDAVAAKFGDGKVPPAAGSFKSADAAATDAATPPPAPEPAPLPTATVAADGSETPTAIPAVATGPAAAGPVAIGSEKLRAAAAAGDPAAAFEIATRYAEGRDVGQNLGTAAEWYKRAAEGGIAVAQYRLGSLYERGQGVTKDLTAAVNWYQRAADQGNVGAMHNLAVLMSEGVDGPPDPAKALEWFLAAGNYGVKDSQYNLGVIFARGIGHDRDLGESYKWFAIAAAQGDTDAAARRDEVGAMLDADQLAKARAAVAAWKPKTPIQEANGVNTPDGGWDDGDGITDSDRMALVKKIQSLLAENGYDPGPADGVSGPKTKEAVKAFQRNIGVAATGEIDGNLVTALASKN